MRWRPSTIGITPNGRRSLRPPAIVGDTEPACWFWNWGVEMGASALTMSRPLTVTAALTAENANEPAASPNAPGIRNAPTTTASVRINLSPFPPPRGAISTRTVRPAFGRTRAHRSGATRVPSIVTSRSGSGWMPAAMSMSITVRPCGTVAHGPIRPIGS